MMNHPGEITTAGADSEIVLCALIPKSEIGNSICADNMTGTKTSFSTVHVLTVLQHEFLLQRGAHQEHSKRVWPSAPA